MFHICCVWYCEFTIPKNRLLSSKGAEAEPAGPKTLAIPLVICWSIPDIPERFLPVDLDADLPEGSSAPCSSRCFAQERLWFPFQVSRYYSWSFRQHLLSGLAAD